MGQMAATRQAVHIVDTREGRAYLERDPNRMAVVELGGVRTVVTVPMLKEGELIGAMAVFRQEVRPFTDKQIDLVTSFARQAVIAMDHEARRGPAQIDADDDAARRRLGNVPLRSGGGGRVHRSGVHSSRGGHGRAGKALS